MNKCAIEGCENAVSNPRAVTCSPEHQAQRRREQQRRMRLTPEQAAESAIERKLLSQQAANEAARREVLALRAELSDVRIEKDEFARALAAMETRTAPRPTWLKTPRDTRVHHGVLVAPFGDAHYGEIVRPEEVAWYNAYDMKIAEDRTRRFFERVILVARQYLAGVEYEGIVVPLLGDLVSGTIHDELSETNELSTYDTVLAAAPWLSAGLLMLREEFGKVHVISVPGNHGRDTRKPRYKGRSAANADTLLARIVAHDLREEKEITFDIPASITADFRVYDVAFRAEHGDEARGGTGIQGALAPLLLRVHRQRRVAQAEGSPFDVLVCGHWHQYMSLPAKGLLVNGSLKGFDEFARGKGFEPEPPQQALLVVTPEHGATVQAPIFVAKRKDEGW